MASESGPSSDDTQSNYENEAFGGVGNNQGFTAPGNLRSKNPTDTSYAADRDRAISQLESRNDNPSPMEMGVLGAVASMNRNNQIDKLKEGGNPVFDDQGNIKGVEHEGFMGGMVYSGDPNFNPNPNARPGGSGGGSDSGGSSAPSGPSQAEIDLQNARNRRAQLLSDKQSELASAFDYFNDDYYGDLETSYSDFSNPGLQTAYDDATRGIYQGFKSSGLISQADLNERIAGLDSQRAIESQRIADAASAYSTAKRDDITKQRQKLGDELSALVGGATDAKSVNSQADALEAFDVAGRVDKLKAPGAKTAMDFFSGYDKVAANQTQSMNPSATFSNAPGAATESLGGAIQKLGSTQPSSLVGINSPFQGSSTKVVG